MNHHENDKIEAQKNKINEIKQSIEELNKESISIDIFESDKDEKYLNKKRLSVDHTIQKEEIISESNKKIKSVGDFKYQKQIKFFKKKIENFRDIFNDWKNQIKTIKIDE